MKEAKHISPFIDLANVPKAKLMKGVETQILTGLNGGKMMMVLTEVLPDHEGHFILILTNRLAWSRAEKRSLRLALKNGS